MARFHQTLTRPTLTCSIGCLLISLSLAAGQQLGEPPLAMPGLARPLAPQNSPAVLTVDTQDRAAVIQFYEAVYKASENVGIEWSGSVPDCLPGDTAAAYKEATIRRINFFRAMAGLRGGVVLDEEWSQKCQEAALMMSAQGELSHTPTPDWACFYAGGAEAGGRANLSMGTIGPSAIDAYIDDPGPANGPVAHRRWILFPPQRRMGTGSVPASGDADFSFPAVNVLWVTEAGLERPPGPEFVAWPPPGYVPYQVLPRESRRWSFGVAGANLTGAQVAMQSAGAAIGVTLEPLRSGYGDNTVVWRPGLPRGAEVGATYEVTINGVLVGGQSRTFSYSVTVIDPAELRITAQLMQNHLVLTWPAQTPPSRLEQASSPGKGPWEAVPVVPQLENGKHTVTLPIQPGQQYFRLRRG